MISRIFIVKPTINCDYYIGFAHWLKPTSLVIEYAKKIHRLYFQNKKLYIVFNEKAYILTGEREFNAEIQLLLLRDFFGSEFPNIGSTLSLKSQVEPDIGSTCDLSDKVKGKFSVFEFDSDNDNLFIDATIDAQISTSIMERIRVDLKKYAKINHMLECDVTNSL